MTETAGFEISNPNAEKKKNGATVRGRVIYDDTNRPVRYAGVTLVNPDDEESSTYSSEYIKTDGQGNFVLKNAPTVTIKAFETQTLDLSISK